MTSDADSTDGTDETDGFFGFVAGLYVAALVAPAIAIGVALRVTTDPGTLYLTLLGSVTTVAVGVGWTTRRESLAVYLGGNRWAWTAIVVPFAYLVALLSVFSTGSDLPEVVSGLAFLGAISGTLIGLGLVVAIHNRYSKAVLRDAEEYARWTARAPERDRRIARGGAVAVFVLGVSGFVASAILGFAPLRWAANVLVPTAVGFLGATDERTLAASDAGLVVKRPLHRRIRPWSDYESYSVSDDALVVHRAGWSAWGLRDVRCGVHDVDDVGNVEAALAEFLLRRRT